MIVLSVFALSVSLTHTFIDLFIGLYGSGAEMNLVGCPPPCSNAWPYQDVAHVASVIVGALAARSAWGARRQAALRATQAG